MMSPQPTHVAPEGEFAHRTVMAREVIDHLAPRADGVYADATAGGGGHSAALLHASAPSGRVIAIDRDPRAVEATRARLSAFGERIVVVHAEFADLGAVLHAHGVDQIDGLVADLGVSSPQVDDPERGFSFAGEGPLDMRMDQSRGRTLHELLDALSAGALADILYQYGEERRSRPIARAIIAARDAGELETTGDLRRAVLRGSGRGGKGKKGHGARAKSKAGGKRIDPATRTFQGLRIALNGELEQLEALLAALPDFLEEGAVAAIISFHSLEDRLVKHRLRDDPRFEVLTKRPLYASDDEVRDNPRARSAKLRAARRRPSTYDPLEGSA